MNVSVKVQLTEPELADLARILGCKEPELPTRMQAIAAASLTEYITMILGQRIFRRGSDIQEYRLFLLISAEFGNAIPDEQAVCRLFQTTASESRSLIRSVMSKYQYFLKGAVDQSMAAVVTSATQAMAGGHLLATINSTNVVDELNRLLAQLDGTLQPVSKKKGSVSTYEISPASQATLKKHLGLT